MEKEEESLFEKLKGKNLEESLEILYKINESDSTKLSSLLSDSQIKMNYLNYLYDLSKAKSSKDLNKLFEFITILLLNKNKYKSILIEHIGYVIHSMTGKHEDLNYGINLINNILKNLLEHKKKEEKLEILGYKRGVFIYNDFIRAFSSNPNLSFEDKYKVSEHLRFVVGEDIFVEEFDRDSIQFFNFYKDLISKEPHLEIKYMNIINEYSNVGSLIQLIYNLSEKFNKNAFYEFDKDLDSLLEKNPQLTLKSKYGYSFETFKNIKNYLFLLAKNNYFGQPHPFDNIAFELIINNEKLCNYNLYNIPETIDLKKILLTGKYDFTDFIINNWNSIFERKNENEDDENDSEEEETNEEIEIFIKSLLNLDYSGKSENKLNSEKLFTFLESKKITNINPCSFLMVPNQPPSFYRYCLSLIVKNKYYINYERINCPPGKHIINDYRVEIFKPEMNVFIKAVINDLINNWDKAFDYTNFINEFRQRICFYCLLTINIHDSLANRENDVNNYFDNFIYVVDPNLESELKLYKKVMIYFIKALEIVPYHKKEGNEEEKIKLIKKGENSYWKNLYKIMIIIYIKKRYNEKYNPELLWESLNSYDNMKELFNLLVESDKTKKNQDIETIFINEMLPKFDLIKDKDIYFLVLGRIKTKEYLDFLVSKSYLFKLNRKELFVETLVRQLINRNLFVYFWSSFDEQTKKELVIENKNKIIRSYLDYTFKGQKIFQNGLLEGLKLALSEEELKDKKLLNPLEAEYPIDI